MTDTTNPKDAIGAKKAPMTRLPSEAVIYGSLGIQEGVMKYGLDNFCNTKVRASIYYDAIQRHLAKKMGGEHADPISGVPHLGSAIAGLAILIKAELVGTLINDLPATSKVDEVMKEADAALVKLNEVFGHCTPKHYTVDSKRDSDTTEPAPGCPHSGANTWQLLGEFKPAEGYMIEWCSDHRASSDTDQNQMLAVEQGPIYETSWVSNEGIHLGDASGELSDVFTACAHVILWRYKR